MFQFPITVETLNNGSLLLSTPQNNNSAALSQRENMQVTQPCSAPSSPLGSPGALNSTAFSMPLPATSHMFQDLLTGVTSSNSSSSAMSASAAASSSSSSGGASGGGHPMNACIDTGDPNWQATKASVRERNAAMFNNDLMADINFVVGSDGKRLLFKTL